MPYVHLLTVLLLALSLGACGPPGDPSQPVPTAIIAASEEAERLVVVLPGRGDDLASLRGSGMVGAIQAAWPDADVILAELALGYYMDGQAARRLHDEIVAPASKRGYREIWLVGASLGGMGALLYDRAYPDGVDGLILLAPYLGDRTILQEISGAGGVGQWDAGPERPIDGGNWQRELWRHVQAWSRDASMTRDVWLAYGDRDRLREAMPLLAPALHQEQILIRKGGHTWSVWVPATAEILRRVQRRRATAAPRSP